MKRFFLMMLMYLVFIAFGTGSISAESEDPTGTLQQIEQLNESHRLAIEGIVANVCLDYHPQFGTILAGDYPVNPKGSTPEEIKANFVKDLEGKGYVINQLNMTQNTLTGRVLVEHLVQNQQVFVWHELTNAPITVINAIVNHDGLCYRLVRVWIQTCTNGAGYWDWQYILVPCDSYNYTVDYYSNQAKLTPYPLHCWTAPPPIDPTGTFQDIYDLNVAHRAQIDALLNNVPLDQHPIYGCVGVNQYPVDPDGMTMDDANAIIAAQTAGMELLDSSVEQVTISGRVLSEHMINGQQAWVWHEYNQTPIFTGTALVRIPEALVSQTVNATNIPGGSGSGSPHKCYVLRWVWTPPCTNGQVPGYWSWKWVEVPCFGVPTPAYKINYSRELGVLEYNF